MWQKGINGWAFAKGTRWAEAAVLAKAAGFQSIEPILEAEGELTPQTGQAECRAIGDAIRQTGLDVSSLATGLFWETSYTAPDPSVRQQAVELTRAALQRARWLGAPVVLVLPGLVSHPHHPAKQLVGYEQALRLANEALRELCHDAEACGVSLAIENVWNQLLVSPVEMREFLDRVNSPWVGAYLDVGNVLRYGFPQDWIDALAGRIMRVHLKDFKLEVGNRTGFCPLGEGDVDWAELTKALKRQAYTGPLIYEGKGDLRTVAETIDRLMGSN